MDKEEKRYREVEKRERLVQTFLIIGGFLLAYSREEIKHGMVSVFSAYLIFVIVYYIYISRTTSKMVNLWAFYSSASFSLLILIFINSQLALSPLRFLSSFLVLTGALTFSLLSPESSKEITDRVEKFGREQEIKHPKLIKIIGIVIGIIGFILIVFTSFIYTLK